MDDNEILFPFLKEFVVANYKNETLVTLGRCKIMTIGKTLHGWAKVEGSGFVTFRSIPGSKMISISPNHIRKIIWMLEDEEWGVDE